MLGNKKSLVVDYLCIVIGTCLMGIAIQSLFDPLGLVMGGFTGIAIIIKQLTLDKIPGGIPLWVTNIVLNIPVFICAVKIKGKRFVGRTAFATLMLSFWLFCLPNWNIAQGDYMLTAIYGGAIQGLGIGFVLLAKATTGGTDMVATLIQHYMKRFSIVQIMMVIDGLVVIGGAFEFGMQSVLYAVVAIFITSKVSDALMEGIKYSKAAFIITDEVDKVSEAIMGRMNRGVTGISAKGMYSGDEKDMLYCVVSKKEIVDLKELVMTLDPHAFVIVTDAREVLGEGFLEY